MIRRFNYTGRRRIEREHARVAVLVERDAPPAVLAELELGQYGLPAEAEVFIEAYRQTSLMRFPWGVVRDARPAGLCRLTDFGKGEGVRFRVKVVEPAAVGAADRPARILAMADRLSPRRVVESVEQAESLLAVESADIDGVWILQFGEDGADEPILQVNRRLVTDRQALVRSEQFVSLVLPEIFRVILLRIFLADGDEAAEDSEDWRGPWIRLAKSLPGCATMPSGEGEHRDDLEDWIEGCVAAFSRRVSVNRRFAEWWVDEVQP